MCVHRHACFVFLEVSKLACSCPNLNLVEVIDRLAITGTIAKGAALLHQEGAREVYACTTHAVFRYVNAFRNMI